MKNCFDRMDEFRTANGMKCLSETFVLVSFEDGVERQETCEAVTCTLFPGLVLVDGTDGEGCSYSVHMLPPDSQSKRA